MNKYLAILVVALVVVVGGYVGGALNGSPSFAGLTETDQATFVNGFRVGLNSTLVMDGSGNFTIPGTVTVTGATSLTGELRAPLVQTGSVTSIASGSVHLTAAQVCDSTVIRQNVHGAGVTASNSATVFPTAAALIADCVPTAGDSKTFVLQNTSDDAAERITPTANTGLDFFIASSSASTLDRKDAAMVRFWNVNGTSVSFSFQKVEDTN
jgi:hypothetical protein